MALCLGFLAFTAVAGIQSLVVELRFCQPHSKAKNRRKKRTWRSSSGSDFRTPAGVLGQRPVNMAVLLPLRPHP